MKYIRKILISIVIVVVGVFFAWLALQQPSHDRDWEVGQEQLPQLIIDGDDVMIHNYRNYDWRDDGSADKNYETRTYKLSQIDSVDVIISHFDDFEGLAHIFVSFGFTDGEYVVVSLETRREQDEAFSPLLGVLRQYEIIYVVGSEEDIVGLRTDVRDERVYVYPTVATPEKARMLFLALANDINAVYRAPRTYNTLTHNCTNEITRKVEGISDVQFPLSWKTILPGYFDEVLYDLKLVPTDADFVTMKNWYHVNNESVDRYNPYFSAQIRN